MRMRQSEHGRKGNIGMTCLATEEQTKLAIKILNIAKHYGIFQKLHKTHMVGRSC